VDPSILSVSELNFRLHARVSALGAVWVEGEVTGYRGVNQSGHHYFSLRDLKGDASISCVLFRGPAAMMRVPISEGLRVRLLGEPGVYETRGALQLIVQQVQSVGAGELAKQREQLRLKLLEEGLLDPAKKRAIPTDPRVIGVVTSRDGAAFQDILRVSGERGPVRILLAHAAVQGEAAPRELIAALRLIARVPVVDVIIIGRGGGSPEDLAAFDNEALAREIARCRKPVIAAVGHEIDWSIACYVADARAATPSHAAEMVTPSAQDRRRRIDQWATRLQLSMHNRVERSRLQIARLSNQLRAPERRLNQYRQLLDELQSRAEIALRRNRESKLQQLRKLQHSLALAHPQHVVRRTREQLEVLLRRLRRATVVMLQLHRANLTSTTEHLRLVSPTNVLSRGYAIASISRENEWISLRDARDATVGARMRVRLEQGEVIALVEEILVGETPDDGDNKNA
jgi:exodeoxyribonuclease VII large subunit